MTNLDKVSSMRMRISASMALVAVASIGIGLALVACGTRDGKPCRHPGDLEAAETALRDANAAVQRDCAGPTGPLSPACTAARRARDLAVRAVEDLRKLPLCES